MSHCFQSQVDVIAFDVNFNIFPKTWPKIFLGDKFSSIIKAKVTSQRIIMIAINQFGLDDFWY